MSYEISDEKIPIGWLKVFEIKIDPAIKSLYKATGKGRVLSDYLSRCGEEFDHRNPDIRHVLIVLERNPNYMPVVSAEELPEMSIGFYTETTVPKINTFSVKDVNFGSRPVGLGDLGRIYGKPGQS